ncbi:MAG: hypothetical protein GEU90_00500 [Gemmatimonas sp.]|nr:hypothetical protein [Gemmatimonas sp.]
MRGPGRVSGGRFGLQQVVVVAEVAVALALMVGAGLMVRSLRAQLDVDHARRGVGADADHRRARELPSRAAYEACQPPLSRRPEPHRRRPPSRPSQRLRPMALRC